MHKGRLEAFSDGVLAIILTIMVLDLKVPRGASVDALIPLWPVFINYVLSFIYIGIYWNNHHHLMQAAEKVDGKVLWANLHLLFWLSLIPFGTAWMGENGFVAPLPVAIYGFVLTMPGIAYSFLVKTLLKTHTQESLLAKSIGSDTKGKISVAICALAIALAFVSVWIAFILYITVALIWLVPDSRIEKKIA